MRSGVAPDEVPNESGLRQLGTRVEEANAKPRVRRSGKPKWRARKKIVVALLSVFALLLVSVGGGYAYLWYRFNQIDKVHISDEVAVQSGAPFTILVIGSDSRVGESAQGAKAFGSASTVTGQRSDVVQLWRVTPSTKQIQIVSIPRDTVVSMLPPDSAQYGTYNRINSSYNTGPDQLVKTITANFGIPINHVVQIDFSGFQSGVNALGGIYLDFPYPAKDAYSGLDITTPGCQLLNGAQALAVARARHYEYLANGYWHFDGTSDFGRIQRQDAFIRSTMSAAKSKVNPFTVNAFIGSIHEGLTIDDGFGLNELIGLALTYRSFDPGNLVTQTLPTVASSSFGGLGDVLTVDQPAAQEMLVTTFGSSLETPTDPPPDAAGYANPPPTISTTTTTTTTLPRRVHTEGRLGGRAHRSRPHPQRCLRPRSTRFPAARDEPRSGSRRPPPPRRDPGPGRSN